MNNQPKHTIITPAPHFIYIIDLVIIATVIIESLPLLNVITHSTSTQLLSGLLFIIVTVLLIDLLSFITTHLPSITRTIEPTLALNRWQPVILTVKNNGAYPIKINLYDYVPNAIHHQQPPNIYTLNQLPLTLQYLIKPQQRGTFTWHSINITVFSLWGFWQKKSNSPLSSQSKVYPDFTALYQLNTLKQWLNYLELPTTHESHDLKQRRPYQQGDSHHTIDWKKTARLHTLMVKDYPPSQNLPLIIMLDNSQAMHMKENNLSYFEFALSAALSLSKIALIQKDEVSLLYFSNHVERYTPPQKGIKYLNNLLQTATQILPTATPANYSKTITTLLSQQQRQALIIFITRFLPESDSALPDAFKKLRQYHPVLMIDIHEPILNQLTQQHLHTLNDTLTYSGATTYQLTRHQWHEKLCASNIRVINSTPEMLTKTLTKQYLLFKESGIL